MNRIELREVSKRYGKKAVLDGLNLAVRQGEIYGLIGKNGAGKTTLFKTVLGLTEIQSGRVSIDGEATQAGLRKARRKIGFFIGGNFFDYLSAEENLRFYCGVKWIRRKSGGCWSLPDLRASSQSSALFRSVCDSVSALRMRCSENRRFCCSTSR